jgi:hypothetical protein
MPNHLTLQTHVVRTPLAGQHAGRVRINAKRMANQREANGESTRSEWRINAKRMANGPRGFVFRKLTANE